MKSFILTISILLFSVMFSSTSLAKWTKVDESVSGITIYVDYERIRKHNGYIYYWELFDFLKPDEFGDLSVKRYNQVDCKLFKNKVLSMVSHKQSMGRDTGKAFSPKNPEWHEYPPPNSVVENVMNKVCNH